MPTDRHADHMPPRRMPPPADPLADTEAGGTAPPHMWNRPHLPDGTRWTPATSLEADIHAAQEDQAGSMAMLGWLVAIAVLVLASLTMWLAGRALGGRVDRLERRVEAFNNVTQCDAPARLGDSMVITVRRDEARLAVRCTPVTHPLHPERIIR